MKTRTTGKCGTRNENPDADPPPEFAARDAEFWAAVSRDIGTMVGRQAKLVKPTSSSHPHSAFRTPHSRRFVPLGELSSGGLAAAPWVWDGFLARGSVTLLSALPKCGKTTLLSHLMKALPAGGAFCGRPLVPGRAAVASEESPLVWEARRDGLGLDPQAVRVLSRPFLGRPSPAEWVQFVRETMAELDADPADLVIFDTLADLWPVRDENSATEVTAAVQPLKQLANNRAVLLVHHLRKSDGAEGTGSRGSGALAGAVDIIVELRRAKASQGGPDGRRVLTALGRAAGIPKEWVVELDEAANEYKHVPGGPPAPAAAREGREEERRDGLREVIRGVLPAGGPGLTRDEIWDRLPGGWRVPQELH